MTDKISVALVGAGAMGGALLKGWIEAGVLAPSSSVFEPCADAPALAAARKAGLSVNPDPAAASADALVLAVKPQTIGDALPRFAPLAARALTVSIMAGVSLAKIAGLVGSSRAARAMPNLPSQSGAGACGLYAPPGVGVQDRRVAESLMRAGGEVVWVRSEREIDVVTAISGSGPAYFFLMVDALAEAGVELGLEADAATRLARATASGAGVLVASDPRAAAELRRAVTSPGGTTEAALKVLDGDDAALRVLMKKAAAAAARRAAEISGAD